MAISGPSSRPGFAPARSRRVMPEGTGGPADGEALPVPPASRARRHVAYASGVGALAGLAGVSVVRKLRLVDLIPIDWALGAWLGASTFGLVVALRELERRDPEPVVGGLRDSPARN